MIWFNEDFGAESCAVAAKLGDGLADPYDVYPAADAEKAIRKHHTNDVYLNALTSGKARAKVNPAGDWTKTRFPEAVAMTAGIMAACGSALDDGEIHGTLSHSMHHADHVVGLWGCFLNGIATVALELAETDIVILDMDAGTGGGTVRMIRHYDQAERVRQYDLSTSMRDRYVPLTQFQNTQYPEIQHYQNFVTRMLQMVERQQPQLVILSLGVDGMTTANPKMSAGKLNQRDRAILKGLADLSVPTAVMLGEGHVSTKIDDDGLADLRAKTVYEINRSVKRLV